MDSTRSKAAAVGEEEADNTTAKDVEATGAGAEVVPEATSVVAEDAVVESFVESLGVGEASEALLGASPRRTSHDRLHINLALSIWRD